MHLSLSLFSLQVSDGLSGEGGGLKVRFLWGSRCLGWRKLNNFKVHLVKGCSTCFNTPLPSLSLSLLSWVFVLALRESQSLCCSSTWINPSTFSAAKSWAGERTNTRNRVDYNVIEELREEKQTVFEGWARRVREGVKRFHRSTFLSPDSPQAPENAAG